MENALNHTAAILSRKRKMKLCLGIKRMNFIMLGEVSKETMASIS